MLHRQRTVLYFLHLAGGAASHTSITKWCFLLKNETDSAGGNAFYEFVPYKYGPFSFCLFQEAKALEEQGLLIEESKSWKLTNEGEAEAGSLLQDIRRDAWRIHKKYGTMAGNDLLDYIYPKYKEYTYFSRYKVMAGKPRADIAIYTAGYEGLTVDGFLNMLIQKGIEQLIDVRNNPVARRYGFHRSTLNRLCYDLGLNYIHVPELGIQSEYRQDLNTQEDRDRLFDFYERTTLVNETEKISWVGKQMLSKPSVLMCMEAQPCQCHRSRLAVAIKAATGLSINHLQASCTTNLPLFNASEC